VVIVKTLIVYANPKEEGHCRAILKELKSSIDDYDVMDLYKMKFNPVLGKDEFTKYGHVKAGKNIKDMQSRIRKVKKLIFVYPHWWGGMPAIMKGFFDRVFTEGFALKFKGKRPKGLLKGKTALVFKTSGAPVFIHKFMGNRDANMIKKEILGFCGIKTTVVQIGMCTELNDKKVNKIKKKVKKSLDKFFEKK
jgi:NAD(P)H dehydrogenase (quinone)